MTDAPLNGSSAWFGTHWGTPDLDFAQQVPTPIGQVCEMCDTAIADGDDGYGMPGIANVDGTPQLRPHWVHRECRLDDVITHLLNCCRCVYPDLTPRQRGTMAIDRLSGS